MKKRAKLVFLVLLIVTIVGNVGYAQTIVSSIGDVDNFSGGDPADAPFRSQAILNVLTPRIPPDDPYKDLDIQRSNWDVGFTHTFPILPGQIIKSATLTMGIYSWDSAPEKAGIKLDINIGNQGPLGGPTLRFKDLPGYSATPNITVEYVIDLSQAPMRDAWYVEPMPPVYIRNLIPELLDGELNIWGLSDNGLDYSILEIEIIPDECTGAIPVVLNVPFNGSTVGATGLSTTTCGYKDTLDVWHSFVPELTGPHTISLCGSSFDTTLSIFDQCGGTELACNDDTDPGVCPFNVQSQITMILDKDTIYYLRVAGHNGQTGDYKLMVTGPSCLGAIRSDLNNDCVVNLIDWAIFASEWLNCNIDPPVLCWWR